MGDADRTQTSPGAGPEVACAAPLASPKSEIKRKSPAQRAAIEGQVLPIDLPLTNQQSRLPAYQLKSESRRTRVPAGRLGARESGASRTRRCSAHGSIFTLRSGQRCTAASSCRVAIPCREFRMRKREGENVASCTERHILDPIDHVTHRRSVHRLARIEVPECTAGPSLNRFQRPGIIPKEHQSTGGG